MARQSPVDEQVLSRNCHAPRAITKEFESHCFNNIDNQTEVNAFKQTSFGRE